MNLLFWILLAQSNNEVNDFKNELSIEERKEITQRLADLITDSALGATCSELNEKREEYIAQGAKLNDLLKRNVAMEATNPKNKTPSLLLNRQKIIYEQKLVHEKLKTITQNIVKSGCPGLDLEETD